MATILLIEDNEEFSALIQLKLLRDGYDVIMAFNGQTGLELAHSQKPDLILLDIMLPDIDGYDVLDLLRHDEATSQIPVIILTALAQRYNVRRGFELGADDFLTKPVTMDELSTAIWARFERSKIQNLAREDNLRDLKRLFIDIISHEFRTPLTVLTMGFNLLDEEIHRMNKEQVDDLLRHMRGRLQELERKLEQISILGMLDANFGFDMTETVSNEMLIRGAILNAANVRATNPGERINLTIQNNTAYTKGNHYPLQVAVSEIISNAYRYSPPESEIAVSQLIENEQSLIIVEDAGMGFPNDLIEQVSRPFVQIDRKKNEQQGLGLGLTLAKRIIEMHNGSLDIKTDACDGTCVRILLPVIEKLTTA